MAQESNGEEHQRFILESAVELDRKLTGKPFQKHSPVWNFLQFFFNLFGFFLGFFLLKIPPARISNKVTAWLALHQSKNKLAPFLCIVDSCRQDSSLALRTISRIYADVRPAKLILISHPETVGSGSYLLGNLIYYAVKINRMLFSTAKFKFVQAIDPFALDTLSPFLKSTYAGFIAAGHIAMDRQPNTLNFFQKVLFSKYHYTKTIFHILRELKSGNTVCLALSGGVVHNSRIFYVIREFAQRVFRSLILAKPLAERFNRGARIQKKGIEKEIISILAVDENSAAVTGRLSEKERNRLISLLRGVEPDDGRETGSVNGADAGEGDRRGNLQQLEEELSLSTPYRYRFFHILFKRVVARGKPLLVLSLTHTKDEKIVFQTPVLITGYEKKQVKWLSSETLDEQTQEERAFVKEFVRFSFK